MTCLCGCDQPTPLASRTDAVKGWVKGQPKPYLPQHARRHWLLSESGCWLWQGHVDEHGYGRIIDDGRSRTAHRIYYEAHFGVVPEGRLLYSRCDTAGCVNPQHWSIRMEDTERRCCSCKQILPTEAFRIRTVAGYRSALCERCRSSQSNHARRARLLAAETDGSSAYEVWVHSEGVCHLCGTPWLFEEYAHHTWHVDHIMPLSRGGSDKLDNKAVACSGCNLRKSAHVMSELYVDH